METLVGKYLVAKWGYSMILATWVKVIKESPKTLLVEEVKGHALNSEELAQQKLSPGYLQCYSVPTDVVETHNNLPQKQFRVYTRDLKVGTVVTAEGPKDKRIVAWVGHPPQMSSRLTFELWDGEPEFEDHCD